MIQAFTAPQKPCWWCYNLTPYDRLSLRTENGDIVIVDNVASGKSGHREINAVRISLALYNKDTKIVDVKPIILRQRKSFSLIAIPDKNGEIIVKTLSAETDTKQIF